MDLTIEQALLQAVEAHKAGKLQDAEHLYRAILQAQPKHPDANHNLGVLAVSVNKAEASLSLFKIALEANPSQPQFWLSYIDALIKEKQFDNARDLLIQGRKAGLAGEKVEALEAQLTRNLLVNNSESTSTNKNLIYRKNHKKASEKNERKKNSALNSRNQNQALSPSQVELNSLLEHYQKGRYYLAENLAREITIKYPDHQFSWKLLGALFGQTGRLQDSLIANQRALKIFSADADVHSNMGNTLSALGRLEDAELSFKKAISIKPNLAEAHYNLGNTLKELGKLQEAETSYKKAIEIKPENAGAHSNLGVTLHELGRLEEAETSCRKAILIKPNLAEAYYNLGNTLNELGKLQEAETSYKKAIAIKPDYFQANSNLGNTLQELGRLEEAVTSYKKAIAIKPEYAQAYSNLGNALKELGRIEDSFIAVTQSIKIKPTFSSKKLFNEVTKQIGVKFWDQSLADLVINALLEPWGRPSDLMAFACRLLKTDNEFVQVLAQSNDDTNQALRELSFFNSISKKEFNTLPLLQAMLSSSPIPDVEIERLLTLLRYDLLKSAQYETLKEAYAKELTPLYCSLAKQCFINEYVYFQTAEEIDLSYQLRNRLTNALEEGDGISVNLLMAVACFFPLYSVTGAEKLLHQKWPDDLKSLLRLQIQEPFEELSLRKSIPALTSIDNQVSLAVQSQYEENPYPRWVRFPNESSKRLINTYIQSKFPLSCFNRLSDDLNPEILIAGCGTGQHSIGTSQLFKGAKILAVDLSKASLAYAKRKTNELDIQSIDYAQADLLKLASLGRTFDVIESAGVLHHLENPFEGWEVLLSLLRPNGLMKLGFYSELARRDIVRVRDLISKAGIGFSSQEIRDYRKHLLGMKDFEDYGFATNSLDFFSTSACRDLLFHVQEHRMTLKVLGKFFKEQNLNFLGFEIDSAVIRSYKNRFPNDLSATNLDQWGIYEEENPNTFAGMYQFWIQKNNNSLSAKLDKKFHGERGT